MVICLGDELLKYIPLAVSLLLKDCEVGGCSVMDFHVHCVCVIESGNEKR